MRHTQKTFLIPVAAAMIAAALLAAPAAIAAEYDFETLDIGAAAANDVNNRGQVVGNAGAIGYLYDAGIFTPIAFPDADRTWAFGINEHGIIVGRYLVDDEQHGFVYDQGVFTTVDYPGAPVNSWAFSINNQGDILGLWCEDDASPTCEFNNATEAYHGYLLDGGGFSVIDFPGAADTYTLDINDTGTIVGQYYDGGGTGFAFELDKHGAWRTLDVPGAAEAEARGITNSGDIVGTYFTPAGDILGFAEDRDGDFSDIEFPGAAFTLVVGSNDRGDVTGTAFDVGFTPSAVVGRRIGQP